MSSEVEWIERSGFEANRSGALLNLTQRQKLTQSRIIDPVWNGGAIRSLSNSALENAC